MVDCDVADLLGREEVAGEDAAVREHAVARTQAPRCGQCRQLVAPKVHRLLDRPVQLLPGAIDLRPVREGRLVVRRLRRLADQLDERHCSPLSRVACADEAALRIVTSLTPASLTQRVAPISAPPATTRRPAATVRRPIISLRP